MELLERNCITSMGLGDKTSITLHERNNLGIPGHVQGCKWIAEVRDGEVVYVDGAQDLMSGIYHPFRELV